MSLPVCTGWLRRPEVMIALALGCSLAAPGLAQAPGHRVFAPQGTTTSYLVDRDGVAVHTWPASSSVGLAAYLDDDGNLLRTMRTSGISGAGAGGGLQKIALDGTVLWDFRYNTGGVTSHHDIEPLPNGNVLMIAWETKSRAEAIAAGRNPSRVSSSGLVPDHVIEVQQTGPTSGAIVWEWHVWDHLIQDYDPAQANYGVVQDHPELIDINYPSSGGTEFNHCNSVDYDPLRDLVIISSRNLSEFWIVDHSTTTAEAAGHTGGNLGRGGDLLYRWGNPATYRRPGTRQLFNQHSVKMIPEGYPGAGNLTIFNNNAQPSSTVFEIELPYDPNGGFLLEPGGSYGPSGPTWTYRLAGFSSSVMSSAERLPNGNTLICATQTRRMIEVTPAGQIVFDYRSPASGPFNVTYVERSMWSNRDTLSVAAGGTVSYDLIAGSRFAGSTYLMMGSLSGTSPGLPIAGQIIPLNYDAYMLATLTVPGSPLFPGSVGVLDSRGRAQAGLALPPGLTALAGSEMHHAFVVLGIKQFFAHISNAERLSLEP